MRMSNMKELETRILECKDSVKNSLVVMIKNKNYLLTNIAMIESVIILVLLIWIIGDVQYIEGVRYYLYIMVLSTGMSSIILTAVVLFYIEKHRKSNKQMVDLYKKVTVDFFGIKEKLED